MPYGVNFGAHTVYEPLDQLKPVGKGIRTLRRLRLRSAVPDDLHDVRVVIIKGYPRPLVPGYERDGIAHDHIVSLCVVIEKITYVSCA